MKLDIHDLRELAIKSIGLYAIICVVELLPTLMVQTAQIGLTNLLGPMAISLLILLGYALLGYLCVFRTRKVMHRIWRNDSAGDRPAPNSALAVLLTLFGVVVVIRSAGQVASTVPISSFHLYSSFGFFVPASVSLVLGLWLIRRPKWIAEFIRRRESASR